MVGLIQMAVHSFSEEKFLVKLGEKPVVKKFLKCKKTGSGKINKAFIAQFKNISKEICGCSRDDFQR